MLAHTLGQKIVLMRKWDSEQGLLSVLAGKQSPDSLSAAHLIREEKIAAAGGFDLLVIILINLLNASTFSVPSTVADMIESSAAGTKSIESVLFGGAPAHAGLASLAAKTFPSATL
jgi:hypothetical protein